MSAFSIPEDIGNRAAQVCRADRFTKFSDFTSEAQHLSFLYDKIRERELRRRVWRFAVRRAILRSVDVTTLLWTPAAYAAGTTYGVGAVVTYGGEWWQSKVGSSTGNTPASGSFWQRYFGPDYLDPFSAPPNTAVAAPAAPVLSAVTSGSLGAATYYVRTTYTTATGETLPSIESNLAVLTNQVIQVASPAAETGATSWNVYVSSRENEETLQASGLTIGVAWTMPTTGVVIGQFPPSTNATSYHTGELTTYGGTIYLSLVEGNTDTPPSSNWLAVGGTTTTLQILYPLDTGPRSDTSTMNVCRLPRGYLRRAPTDPKGSQYHIVGVSLQPMTEDWVFEGDYIVTREVNPILLRFVANMVDVPDFDPMFCEAFAAALAKEAAPKIAPKEDRTQVIREARTAYTTAVSEAGIVNGIEQGSQSSYVDDWITVRF